MESTRLAGCTVLLLVPDVSAALDLQDSLSEEGARVLTAYRVERALLLADRITLSAAVFDDSLLPDVKRTFCEQLAKRGVPVIFANGDVVKVTGWMATLRSTRLAPGAMDRLTTGSMASSRASNI